MQQLHKLPNAGSTPAPATMILSPLPLFVASFYQNPRPADRCFLQQNVSVFQVKQRLAQSCSIGQPGHSSQPKTESQASFPGAVSWGRR